LQQRGSEEKALAILLSAWFHLLFEKMGFDQKRLNALAMPFSISDASSDHACVCIMGDSTRRYFA
jgi:hypothetical protein